MRTRTLSLLLVVAATLALGGCGPLKLRMPRLPEKVLTPDTAVSRVMLVESGEEAARYDVVVTMTNPNDAPLPLDFANYELKVGGKSYASDILPNAVLPRNGQVSFTLPAVIKSGAQSGGEFEASGNITYTKPGQLRKLLYDIGWPKPKAPFNDRGTINEVKPAKAAETPEK